ncbi:COBRA-like protein 7 isoform X2 [Ananas comosus]|nr:COBRA-like protein 7 isoform X2 [Ananas comosus]XP_020095399.1 COBRA-like protein 7 isoform X2 [Ananas comosus]
MDPQGNITINWDFKTITDVYTVIVSIHNYQLYRHIEPPGWKLSWTWSGSEVIWDMKGAETTEQGNCSTYRGDTIPHSCEKNPVVVDLPADAPYNAQAGNCCRGGVLTSIVQDPTRYMSAFEMIVRNPMRSKPSNFSIGVAGYTCGDPVDVPPSKYRFDGQRYTQALKTWQVTCSYSQFRESDMPSCCVSLSAFYYQSIVSCPDCSCGCQGSPAASQCISEGQQPNYLQIPKAKSQDEPISPVVMCTQHMCPIRVHWHLKSNYKDYWRVKVTITNLNFVKNYSDWSLVMQHPNLGSLAQVFSFNFQPLFQIGETNDTVMLWGIERYNDMLLQSGASGNVQSEMLLKKDPREFTFKGGWGFPRRVSFNGHDCIMPSPDAYPALPNGSPRKFPTSAAVHQVVFMGLSPLVLYVVVLLL